MGNDKESTNVFERLFKLRAKVDKLMIEGKRDPEPYLDFLQKTIDTLDPKMVQYLYKRAFVPASEPFVVDDWFQLSRGANLSIVSIPAQGGIFTEYFGGMTEEGNCLDIVLNVHEAREELLSPAIIRAVGGEEKAETTLRDIALFLRFADEGTFHFFVKDKKGVLRRVKAEWERSKEGWRIYPYDVDGSAALHTGELIVSVDEKTMRS